MPVKPIEDALPLPETVATFVILTIILPFALFITHQMSVYYCCICCDNTVCKARIHRHCLCDKSLKTQRLAYPKNEEYYGNDAMKIHSHSVMTSIRCLKISLIYGWSLSFMCVWIGLLRRLLINNFDSISEVFIGTGFVMWYSFKPILLSILFYKIYMLFTQKTYKKTKGNVHLYHWFAQHSKILITR